MQGKRLKLLYLFYDHWFRESSSCPWWHRGFFRAVFTGIGLHSLIPPSYISPSAVFDLYSLSQLLWLHLLVVLCGVFALFSCLQVYHFIFPKATKSPESRDPTQYFCQACVLSESLSFNPSMTSTCCHQVSCLSCFLLSAGLWPVCVVCSLVHPLPSSLCYHPLCPLCHPVHLFTLLDSGHCSPPSAGLSLVFCHGLVTPSLYLSSSPCSFTILPLLIWLDIVSWPNQGGHGSSFVHPTSSVGCLPWSTKAALSLLCLSISSSSFWSSLLVFLCSTLS